MVLTLSPELNAAMKRILLFLATNLAILIVLSIVVQVLGLDRYLAARGQPRRAPGLRRRVRLRRRVHLAGHLQVDGQARHGRAASSSSRATPPSSWLVEHRAPQAQAAGIGMPEVGIFDSPEPNAFATGASRNKALVAVSTGLLAAHESE